MLDVLEKVEREVLGWVDLHPMERVGGLRVIAKLREQSVEKALEMELMCPPVSIKAAARRLDLHPMTIRNKIRSGEIPAVQKGPMRPWLVYLTPGVVESVTLEQAASRRYGPRKNGRGTPAADRPGPEPQKAA